MPTVAPSPTLADLLGRLGDLPPGRVISSPPPGTATEADVLALRAREGRLCELVEGVLVENPVGLRESILAIALAAYLRAFVIPRNLGIVTGADGMLRLFPGIVRIPDVAFVSWRRIPGRKLPDEPIPGLVPDLAAEVLNRTNTPAEMARKCREYFQAGVRLIWEVDPASRTVSVLRPGGDPATTLGASDVLDGGDVLSGFAFPLDVFFAELDRFG